MQQSSIETFTHLSQFNSLKHFNDNIQAFLFEHKKDFSSKQLLMFKALSRFACKVAGVSNISINKLLRSLSNQGIDCSESTFHRMKRIAIKLGILESIPTIRKDNSQSSNVWVFRVWMNRDTPKKEESELKSLSNQHSSNKPVTGGKTSNSISKASITLKELRKDEPFDSSVELPVSDWVDSSFAKYGSSFFPNEQVEELWKIAYIHSKIIKLDSRTLIEQANHAIKQLVRKLKGRGRVESVNGYFNGICKRRMKTAYIKNLWESCWS